MVVENMSQSDGHAVAVHGNIVMGNHHVSVVVAGIHGSGPACAIGMVGHVILKAGGVDIGNGNIGAVGLERLAYVCGVEFIVARSRFIIAFEHQPVILACGGPFFNQCGYIPGVGGCTLNKAEILNGTAEGGLICPGEGLGSPVRGHLMDIDLLGTGTG